MIEKRQTKFQSISFFSTLFNLLLILLADLRQLHNSHVKFVLAIALQTCSTKIMSL